MSWRVVVGGIYSPNHQNGRWGWLLSYGALDSSVRQPRHPTVRVQPLELLTCGPPDSSVVHRTGPIHCPVRHLRLLWLLRAQSAHCSSLFTFCRRPLALFSRYSAGAPDSPVLHRTVQWIIAEWLSEFPKLASLRWSTLVHRTLSGGTPDSPVRETKAAFGCLLLFFLNPFLDFLLVCVEPLAPVELII
jgi:hypothetical protein